MFDLQLKVNTVSKSSLGGIITFAVLKNSNKTEQQSWGPAHKAVIMRHRWCNKGDQERERFFISISIFKNFVDCGSGESSVFHIQRRGYWDWDFIFRWVCPLYIFLLEFFFKGYGNWDCLFQIGSLCSRLDSFSQFRLNSIPSFFSLYVIKIL